MGRLRADGCYEVDDADRTAFEQDGFVRPARPEIDRVDWITRRLRTDEPKRDGNILWTGLRANSLKRLQRKDLSALDACSCRGTQPQLKLAGVDGGEISVPRQGPTKRMPVPATTA